jgi:hypothetical protein
VTSLQVDPAVQNLDMLKVGDTVVATYIVAVAAPIAEPGKPTAPAQAILDLPKRARQAQLLLRSRLPHA